MCVPGLNLAHVLDPLSSLHVCVHASTWVCSSVIDVGFHEGSHRVCDDDEQIRGDDMLLVERNESCVCRCMYVAVDGKDC